VKRTVLALTLRLIGAVALGAGASNLAGIEGKASAEVNVSIGVFTDTLSPYGTWVTVEGVGRVWRPRVEVVGDDFQPYATGGHWVYTDYGWSFESDWDWGWAPFHYGRWYDDPNYGWVWVAGTTWGPAWVDWRFGSGYVGWVPLAPAGVTVTYVRSPRYWCFVPEARFTERRIWEYRVPRERAQVVYSSSVVVASHRTWEGTRFNAGPPPERIATVTGHPIVPVRFTPPRRGEVTNLRMTTHGVERHAPPAPTTRAAPRPLDSTRHVPAGPAAPPRTAEHRDAAPPPARAVPKPAHAGAPPRAPSDAAHAAPHPASQPPPRSLAHGPARPMPPPQHEQAPPRPAPPHQAPPHQAPPQHAAPQPPRPQPQPGAHHGQPQKTAQPREQGTRERRD
jgi:hypothetical protein